MPNDFGTPFFSLNIFILNMYLQHTQRVFGASMISYATSSFSAQESLGSLNLYVRKWFEQNFTELTPPQRFSFKLISEDKNVLICAPTGSGKTISGFLSIISRLFDYSMQGKLEEMVYCIYVSPLRALNNDVYKNLLGPIEQIYSIIRKELGIDVIKQNIMPVRVGIRTGDTSQSERRRQLLHPPNILVTTPESLAILLNSDKFAQKLRQAKFLIIDELHGLAGNKRGVHLSLSIARLEHMIGHRLLRIGLGATMNPMDEAAKYLVGCEGGEMSDCIIVDASWDKGIDAKVAYPKSEQSLSIQDDFDGPMYAEIDRIIQMWKSTIIFTNTRAGTERVALNLKRRFKYGEEIAAHHGSLSRQSRLEVEELLKKGSLKCAISSTSLELGIDVGAIDMVVQLGSPKSTTRILQRIGRAGHSYKAIARGEIIASNRDDLFESSVLLNMALKRQLDLFSVPKNSLDILAQHIIGMAIGREWDIDLALGIIRNAYPYVNLTREDMLSVLNSLTNSYGDAQGAYIYPKIRIDKAKNTFKSSGAIDNGIYMLNSGTIPDSMSISVFDDQKHWIGSIDEDFAAKLNIGDIFALGGRMYKFENIRDTRCYVSLSTSNLLAIPPWHSEQLSLAFECASQINELRRVIFEHMRAEKHIRIISSIDEMPNGIYGIIKELPMDQNEMLEVYNYFAEQMLFAAYIPNSKLLLIEQTCDALIGKNLVIFHSMFGRAINDALSRLVAENLAEMHEAKIRNIVCDSGFVLDIDRNLNISAREIEGIFRDIRSRGTKKELKRSLRDSELLKRHFRYVASRSFMVLRNYKGIRASVRMQQRSSNALLKAALKMEEDSPVLREAYSEVMYGVMDVMRTCNVIDALANKTIKCIAIKTTSPSPFSHEMITLGHLEMGVGNDIRMHKKRLHDMVMDKIS